MCHMHSARTQMGTEGPRGTVGHSGLKEIHWSTVGDRGAHTICVEEQIGAQNQSYRGAYWGTKTKTAKGYIKAQKGRVGQGGSGWSTKGRRGAFSRGAQ
jgi:hypothetical protein